MMKIFLDTSNVEEIRKRYYTGLIDGVTTNPTLMLREGRDPVNVISEIQEIFQDDPNASISAEVSGDTADEMLAMAEDYLSIGPAITIKVPCTVDGLVACKVLSEQDVKVNVTLIFNAAQAILAAKAGATYVSPFVGRLDDQSIAGLEVVRSISEIYCRHGVQTKILAASIREVHRAVRSWYNGADVCTMPLKTFDAMYNHILTDKGLEQFNADWAALMND
jgi:transaldolase